ncbi:DUF4349 domain-containing protein [Portibacter lacus]|nr:DUF4349 domain-containing protein [Portibacter lacus]
MKIKIYLLFLALFLMSCENSSESKIAFAPEADELYMEEASFQDESGSVERKLITEGALSFETSDLINSRKQILESVKKHGGYIASDQESNSTTTLSNDITVRIPSDKMDLFLAEATSGITKFDFKNINARDVTDQFLDLTTRIKTNRELESRFLEILQKANKVDELLQVERELGRIRNEIESQEGRLKLMNNQISYATLSIHFYKKVSSPLSNGPQFARGFENGWKNLIQFIIGIVNLWPFIIILIVALIGFRKWRKNKT